MTTESEAPVLGLKEIATLLGIEYDTIRVWRARGKLPTPDWTVSGNPMWERGAAEVWVEQRLAEAKRVAQASHPAGKRP